MFCHGGRGRHLVARRIGYNIKILYATTNTVIDTLEIKHLFKKKKTFQS